jgi:4-hydroxy-tetrahydrodipicolinate synthase
MALFERSEARDWFRETMRGVANVVVPSFTQNLSGLNEAAIRHDIRVEIERGFVGTLLVSETATTAEEYIQFVEWAADEAAGRLVLIFHASFNTLEENIEVGRRAQAVGAEATLLSYPPTFYPTSEHDIFDYTKAFCDGVDMAVILFPVPLWGFERLHPASLSVFLMEKLVRAVPNIAAIKAEGGHPSIAGFTETWNRLADQVVVTMPLESQGVPLATLVPMQLIATSNTEYFGDAVPRMMSLIFDGKVSEAMELFWQIDPARRADRGIGAIGGANMVHRMAWKYQAWLTGFSGGPLRQPTARLVWSQMGNLRQGLVASDLPVTSDPDSDFFVGRFPT